MAVINQAGGVIPGTEDPDTITNTAAAAATLNGLGGNDTLQGNTATDSLNGGAGADVMIGGGGADTYVVDNLGDQIVENAGGDVDVLQSAISYTLSPGALVEVMTLNLAATPGVAPGTGTADLNLTGNDQSQTAIVGNGGNNILDGGLDQVAANGTVTAVGDTLIGGLGNDTFVVRTATTDVVQENNNEGVDTVLVAQFQAAGAGPSAYVLGDFVATGANNTIVEQPNFVENIAVIDATSTFAANITGNGLSQNISGNAAANLLDGGFQQRLNANTVVVGPPAVAVGDQIRAFSAASDTLTGFGGNDTYVVRSDNTAVVEADGQGTDVVRLAAEAFANNNGTATATFTLAAGVSIETIDATNGGASASAVALNIVGNELSQLIQGNAGNNNLNGGAGEDTLIGLGGNDVYTVNSAGDIVSEDDGNALFPGAGAADRINTTISYQLAQNQFIEILAAGTTSSSTTSDQDGSFSLNGISAATGDRFLVGNVNSQLIIGSSGANILDGNQRNTSGATINGVAAGALGGADTLAGLGGDDTYRVYAQTNVVLEDRGGGFDRIFTDASFSLTAGSQVSTLAPGGTALNGGATFYAAGQAEIELLSTASNAGTTAIDLAGNGYGQIIVGNNGVNNISGGYGNAGATLGGTALGGVEALIGLGGSDIYTVTSTNTFVYEDAGNAAGAADVVNVDDAVVSTFTLNGGSYVETLQALAPGSTNALVLVGNEQVQEIIGNAGSNTLNGGGFGAGDTLRGLGGDDAYRVFNGSDTIIDTGGTDSIFATGVSYQLAQGVAVEYISSAVQGGGEAIFLVGNDVQQVIVGNYGDNTLDGNRTSGASPEATTATNSDTLVGLFGSDIYRVYGANNNGNGFALGDLNADGDILDAGETNITGDVVLELGSAGGYDQVFASGNYQLRIGTGIEALSAASQTATGAAAEYILRGNNFAQLVVGNDAANTIDGRQGNDTLTGRGGNDVFAFTTALDATNNVDQVTDFAAGDRIGLSNDNNAGTNTANEIFANALFDGNGVLTQADFQTVTTGSGTNSGAHIIFNSASGQLFYDADGAGFTGSVLFAQLAVGTQLGFNDIIAQALVTDLPAIG